MLATRCKILSCLSIEVAFFLLFFFLSLVDTKSRTFKLEHLNNLPSQGKIGMKQKSCKVKTVNLKQFLFLRSSLLRWGREQSLILQRAPACPSIHLVKILGLYRALVILYFQQFWKYSLTSSLHHLYFACSC